MKGIDIVVGGSVGHMSAFMAQAGNLVVCGDAGAISAIRSTRRGSMCAARSQSLGADCVEKQMTPHHLAKLAELLEARRHRRRSGEFRRYGSARKLYNFHVDHAAAY